MKCPKCHSEVADWHFYCSDCHALVNDYNPGAEKSDQRVVERAGRRLLSLLVAILIVGLMVLMARAIRWEYLVSAIRGEMHGVINAEKERASRAKPLADPKSIASNSPVHNESSSRAGKSGKVESVRALQQKIEELPSPDNSSASPDPAPAPKNESISLPSPPEPPSALKPVPLARPQSIPGADFLSRPPVGSPSVPPVRPLKDRAELSVERIEIRHSGEVGYVAINSYVPARIYLNGQFSGLTPRTVKLAVGDHQIRLIAEGYEDWTRRIRLNRLQQIGIMASMKKKVSQ